MGDQDWHAAAHATEKANSLRPDLEHAIRELIAAAHWSATVWEERGEEFRAAELRAVAEELMVDWTKFQQHAAQVWSLANGRTTGGGAHGDGE